MRRPVFRRPCWPTDVIALCNFFQVQDSNCIKCTECISSWEQVLDVCCGSGDIGLLLADVVGPQGQVTLQSRGYKFRVNCQPDW